MIELFGLDTINYPFIAFILAGFLLVLGFVLKSKWLKIAGLIWVSYGIWEYLMYFKLLCQGACNIRIDLLLIYPLLMLVSLGAIIHTIFQKFRTY